MALDLTAVDQAVARHGPGVAAVIPILTDLQQHYRYLPEEALRRVCELSEISPARITSVAGFYARFRLKPAGAHIIRVCHGTACHVKGSELVEQALRRRLKMAADVDTSDDGQFTIERVGCVGCCTLAPVVQIDELTYGHRSAENAAEAIVRFIRRASAASLPVLPQSSAPDAVELRIGCGSCCLAGGSGEVRDALADALHRLGGNARVKTVGCVGMCHRTPLVTAESALYDYAAADMADAIVRRHVPASGLASRVKRWGAGLIDWVMGKPEAVADERRTTVEYHPSDDRLGAGAAAAGRNTEVAAFTGPQVRLATEGCGELDPLDVQEYERHGGFAALDKARRLTPAQIIAEVDRAGLRGRGGAGFPTARKWRAVADTPAAKRYIICNGDEGDPGAFMDRMILESFPYRVLEGMAIAARAVGADEGVLYIRSEYPLALQRVADALERCGDRLGVRLRIAPGAGAFVCGEETALIASLEGNRGLPRFRPPYPASQGLNGLPTLINNVETYALVPWIIREGGEAFARIGTATGKGTKVFALTGKVRHGGLIEVPLGTTIRQIVEQIGGGPAAGRTFKAVQIGGPSGGCIPAALADLPIDFEQLQQAGAIMGSGGLVVLDDRDCMVDMARYFLKFTQAESCGRCTLCRVGTRVLLQILDRLCEGSAKPGDLDELEMLCGQVKHGSLCGLGQTAPNPVLTTLRYFRHEYEAHLKGKCPAGKCAGLIRYQINGRCIGCTRCAQVCPADAIAPLPYQLHVVDHARCVKCDLCRTVCPENAVEVV